MIKLIENYEYYNANPKDKNVGDCVKRSLSKAFDIPYNDVKNELNRIKRELGEKAFNSDAVWREFLNRHNAEYIKFSVHKGHARMDGNQFCSKFPKGRYVLRMAGHLTACVDGTIYDTWDCSNKCVYGAFAVGNSTTIPRSSSQDLNEKSFKEFLNNYFNTHDEELLINSRLSHINNQDILAVQIEFETETIPSDIYDIYVNLTDAEGDEKHAEALFKNLYPKKLRELIDDLETYIEGD